MVNQEIKGLTFRRNKVQEEALSLSYVVRGLTFFEFSMFCSYVMKVCTSERIRRYEKCSRQEMLRHVTPPTCLAAVHNLSKYQLSDAETFALSFGWGFCVPQTRKNRSVVRAQFECLYGPLRRLQCSDPIPDGLLKNQLVVLSDEVLRHKTPYTGFPLNAWHLSALQNLRKNNSAFISRPDKGTGVVIMDSIEYRQKIHAIIDDRSKFVPDSKQSDQQGNLLDTVRKTVSDLRDKGSISGDLSKELVPKCARIPVLYGLPKIHKADVPVRPILSMRGCAVHKLAGWLALSLLPVRRTLCRHNIDDSFAFKQAVGSINISGQQMASLDVQSLFTSIPVDRCLDVISRVAGDTSGEAVLDPVDLTALIKLCVQNIQFRFDGVFYRQVDGVAMGSPLGPFWPTYSWATLKRLLLPPSRAALCFIAGMSMTFLSLRKRAGKSRR